LLVVKTYIASSAIEGVGVFAAEPVAKGAVIWRTDSAFDMLVPIATYRSAAPHLRELLERYAYPSADRPGFLVYEIDNGRFMNHATKPNTDFASFGVGTAIRRIHAHEEITCDYAQFYQSFEANLGRFDPHATPHERFELRLEQ
jgi:SET domain-containing protein